jgi:hypothetical protein
MGLIAGQMVEIIMGEVIHTKCKDTRSVRIINSTIACTLKYDGFFMTKMNLRGAQIVKSAV